jgi:hypothetical protein
MTTSYFHLSLFYHISNFIFSLLNVNIQEYHFACGSVWVWNLVPYIMGAKETQDIWEQGTEGDVWTEEEWGVWRVKKIAYRGASWFVLLAMYTQNNQVEEDESGGACSTKGGEEERGTSVTPANHSTDYSTLIIYHHPGLVH